MSAEASRGAEGGPLISLLMPVWQPQIDWLLTAVRTALAQERVHLELVVVDDGCPEPVEGMLSGVGDDRLRVLRIEHGGVARARNAGIAAARGDYIRFIDADDALEPGSSARLLALTGGRDDRISYGATVFCDEQLRPVWKMTSRVRGDAVAKCLLGRFTVRPPALLFPRDVVAATGEWDPGFRVSVDWDYVLRALEHADVVGDRQAALWYRKRAGSLTSNIEGGREGARRVVTRYFERHPDQLGSALERRARAMLDAQGARVCASHGRHGDAVRYAWRAVRSDPRALGGELLGAIPALGGRLLRGLPTRRRRQPAWP